MSTEKVPGIACAVRPFRGQDGTDSTLLAFADVTIAGHFVIKGLRVIMGPPKDGQPGRPFVAWPAKKGAGAAADKWFEIAHPITAEARAAVNELIMKAYGRVGEGG